jgi:ketosteroid isomerase-like protein
MNRIHVAPCFALALLAALAGCQGAAPPGDFPQKAADGWLGSFNGGDVDGLSLMYSEDAQVMPPDSPIVAGHDAINEFWQSYNPGQVRIEVTEADTKKLGDFWFREGAYKAVYSDEGEPRVGKFIELWKKEGNAWLLYRQMWSPNSQLPVLAQPESTGDEPS